MNLFSAGFFLILFTNGIEAQPGNPCPVCRAKTAPISEQTDDVSKPSKNLAVWNRSLCANPFFTKGSTICLRDGYAYDFQMKRWELCLEDRDSFAHPLEGTIHKFPLPPPKAIKSRTVYSQVFVTLDVIEHGILFWTNLDNEYFERIRKYSKERGITLEIKPHDDLVEAVIMATIETGNTGRTDHNPLEKHAPKDLPR